MKQFVFQIATFLFLSSSAWGQQGKPPEIIRSPFRYVIVADVTELQKYINRGPGYHDLVVVIEEKAFTEKNLRELFTLLSKRFNERPALYVSVTTSLEAVRTPEEYDQIHLGGGLNERAGEFKQAFYSRSGNGESFWYQTAGLSTRKDIIISPYAPKNWPK